MAVIHVDMENFKQEIGSYEGKVLVDFWATWCGPCQMMAPVVDELSEELENVKVVKIDIDKALDLALEYKVVSIPTFAIFEKGELVRKIVGAVSKEELLEFVTA